jgi:phosphatidylserine decarboxylase
MKLDREALPFSVTLVALAAAGAFFQPWAAAVPAVLLAFTLWFFRDPERRPPGDPAALLSPADGRIIVASARRVSVFMNVFDVHVCRSPVAGTVASVEHVPGSFLSAFRDAASEHNERTSVVVDPGGEPVRFTLVAGLIARRIVCRVGPGRALAAGERIGLIRFGSRVDVDLPPGARPVVRVGDRVVGGETVIARRA